MSFDKGKRNNIGEGAYRNKVVKKQQQQRLKVRKSILSFKNCMNLVTTKSESPSNLSKEENVFAIYVCLDLDI